MSVMRKLRMLGVVLVALFVVGAVAAATSSAVLPISLPLATSANPVKFTDKSGAGTFRTLGGTVITGTSDESTGEYLSTALGEFDILFLGVTSSGLSCTGLSDTVTGSILVLGTFHLVYLLWLTAKHVGVAFLLNEVHFTCGGLVLARVRGCLIGLILPVNTPVATTGHYTVTLKQSTATSGDQEYTTYLNEENNGSVKCLLESSTGTGAFESAAEETVEEIEKLTQGGTAVTSEVMA
jgi:hypothetical protein